MADNMVIMAGDVIRMVSDMAQNGLRKATKGECRISYIRMRI